MTDDAPIDWHTVPVPVELQARPRNPRGFIIPYSVDDGTGDPDFRVTYLPHVLDLIKHEQCWLCGQPRTYWMCFIGGPLSMENRHFNDGWMHESCASYALKVCPFLASPKGHYTSDADDVRVHPLSVDYRPERFGLGYTRSFDFDPKVALMVAAPFKRIRWFTAWGREVLDTITL